MQLIEVKDKLAAKEFLMLPVRLYRNEENYIRPLDKDIDSVFDPEKNKYFQRGDCTRWILVNETNETIGRVAAFIDQKSSEKEEQPTGGMGFFECIDNQEAAFKLFDQCKDWLEGKGMEAMDGPINFGDRDRWWGLLVDGFTEPNYCMPYNFKYYQALFEAYDFKLYFNQYTYQRPMGGEVDVHPKFYAWAERLMANPDFTFRHLTKADKPEMPRMLREVYNAAWSKHEGVEPITEKESIDLFKQFEPILDYKLLWFAFHQDQPIGLFITMPELNQIFKKLNGKLDLIGKIKFMYYKWTKACTKGLGLVFGVIPEFQRKGVDLALIVAYTQMAWKPGFQYKDLEMNWVGDFNPKMMRVSDNIGAKIYKTHITYRKLFDETKEFKRHPII